MSGAPTPEDVLAGARALADGSQRLLDAAREAEDGARHALAAALDELVAAALDTLPVASLKTATEGRLRLGPIEDAGITTVGQLLRAGADRLDAIDGVGPKTAAQALAAAEQVERSIRRTTRLRPDVDGRPPIHTATLEAARHLAGLRSVVAPIRAGLEWATTTLPVDITPADLETRRFRRLLAGRARRTEAARALDRLTHHLAAPTTAELTGQLAQAEAHLDGRAPEPADVWDDYLARPVFYNGLLADVGGSDPREAAVQGLLPADIVAEIERLELDTSLLVTSLRGYQSFGARFALVQRRAILGDEMGLGKTIEALAVLCHLWSAGATHALVISPASVLANWEHEIRRHTELSRVHVVHGTDRHDDLARWTSDGGVALTTYDTLRRLTPPSGGMAAVIVDEAHFAKNPEALRTQAVREWLARADYALLLTGTPMENRVDEFRVLVDHVRPDLAATITAADAVAGADAFRRAVAPSYLRRNQIDVLDELPPRIETADWLVLDGPSADAYRQAVASGNFMAMRRAAFLTPDPGDSPKLTRLLEIVDEAVDNNRKVVVFSYFRDVIDRICQTLDGVAVGPITGDVPAARRQELVDRFSRNPEPVVLVSQIEAGGVGLNIQAASVVILTEPQWKPTVEEQAIARCHRMGQVRPVEVHRLLTMASVDERMLAVLASKSRLFADYVHLSAMKDASPQAIDVTDLGAVSTVADTTTGERLIIAQERLRLGLDDGAGSGDGIQ